MGGGGRLLCLFVKSFLSGFREKQHRNIFSHQTGRLPKFGWILLTYLKISVEMAVTWLLPGAIQLLHLWPTVITFVANCYYICGQLLHLWPVITFVTSTTVARQVAGEHCTCGIPSLQLVRQQVARKEQSTFRNVTRQLATCDIPTATCHAMFS